MAASEYVTDAKSDEERAGAKLRGVNVKSRAQSGISRSLRIGEGSERGERLPSA